MNCKLIFKNLFLVSLLLIGVTACSDNDNPKGGEVSQDLTTTIERINQSVESMQHLVTMLSEHRNITEVNLEAGSADLKFRDLATVSVYSGQTNSAIPTLSFAKKDNKYYWTVVYQGKTTELTTISRDPLEVKPLKTSTGFPVIGTLYKEGIGQIWTVDTGSGSYALLDESGKEILASADPKFTAFDNIELSNADYIGLSLVGIEDVLKISRVDISFRISLPEDNLPVLFKYEASQEVSYSVNNLTEVAIKAILDLLTLPAQLVKG
ncbi:PL29 family lyase N-terminal domain-containing protein [Bacteroides propionicifaciens]|uniref:PL29 family lyase N-terminal domain-containing protein n=2 Tax=Bacteroides propionicifaciens TaxID=392838 RepID=UPI00138AAD9D|nr:PL29 family lyase N-terminal domain-containing protein [Bacteroides propionicifaciens]